MLNVWFEVLHPRSFFLIIQFLLCKIQWNLAAIALNMFSYTTHLSVSLPYRLWAYETSKNQANQLPHISNSSVTTFRPKTTGSISHHKGRQWKNQIPVSQPASLLRWSSPSSHVVLFLPSAPGDDPCGMMEPWVYGRDWWLNGHLNDMVNSTNSAI